MSTDSSETLFKIKCPGCQKKLRIEDRRLIGKKVKCPNCKTPILVAAPATPATEGREKPAAPAAEVKPPQQPLIQEHPSTTPPASPRSSEDEVQLELVTDDLPVGTSAKWIPDSPVLPDPQNVPAAPQQPAEPTPTFPDFSEPSEAKASPLIAPAAADNSGSELNRYRARKKKSWGPTIIVGLFLMLGVGTVAYFALSTKTPSPQTAQATTSDAGGTVPAAPVDESAPYSRERLAYSTELVKEFKPTEGEPLALAMMPRGVTFVIHLRPALLWSPQYQELKVSLTDDVTSWIAAKLKEVCHRDPEQVEEVYLGFILGAGGSEPEVCSVVHLKEPAKMSDLIDEFKGEYVYDITERPDVRLKQDDKYAYLIKDESTFAIAPRLYATELEESRTLPFELSVPLENLRRETDDQRLITLLGVTRDLQTHYPKLMPEAMQPAISKFLEWIGEDVEAISWSVQPSPYLHSELNIHPVTTSNPAVVQQRIQQQFSQLPQTMWKELCVKMSPQEMRFRNFIGRFPAMVEAFRQSTISGTTANFVSMTTVLPAKAAPNLALATLFTVNEAARTDFSVQTIAMNENNSRLPNTVVERLQIPVDSEFNRRPLEMALQYLCDEIEVKLAVNGDALKDAGYTKNMPQTFNLGVVPVERALAQIVNTYQEPGKIMVMSIDEKTKTIHILTEKFAKQLNMPIYEFKKD